MLANGMSVSELVSQLGSRFNEADPQDDQPKNMTTYRHTDIQTDLQTYRHTHKAT